VSATTRRPRPCTLRNVSDETPLGAVRHGLAQAAPGRAAITCGGITRYKVPRSALRAARLATRGS
jgi:hypothetical protein